MPTSHINIKRTSRWRTDVAVGVLLAALVGIGLYESENSDAIESHAAAKIHFNSDRVANSAVTTTIAAPQGKSGSNEESQLPSLQDLAQSEDGETREEAQALLVALADEEAN